MIINEKILIKGHPKNIKHYSKYNYNIKVGESIYVDIIHLMTGSTYKIKVSCDDCSKERNIEFREYNNCTNGLIEKYYCNKCKGNKIKETCVRKYGVDNVMKVKNVKSKLTDSLLKRYGVDHYSKTDEYKEKYKNTCLDRYGVTNSFIADDFKEKSKNTNLEKYGVDHYSKTDEYKIKVKETSTDRYGVEYYSKTDECKEKVKETFIDKYGVDNYSKTDEYKIKVKETLISRYGVDSYSKTDEYKIKVKGIREKDTKDRYEKIIGNEYKIISYNDYIFEIFHSKCNLTFRLNKDLLYARNNLGICICANCNPIGLQSSFLEKEVFDFLSLYVIDIKTKCKDILDGKEIDIFLPKNKIGIEVNGIYWHSEYFKDKFYHLNKTILSNKKNIDLIHIWEDDWKYKQNIVKSILLNRINKVPNKIYARKCKISFDIPVSDAKDFLNNNHIQGHSNSTYKIGLYHNDELVSLMTFGYRKTNSKKEFELIRFCNKINTNVIGAASKLFSNFIKNIPIDVNKIISYSDMAHFDGNLYKVLGFDYCHLSKPNYFWVVDGVRKHRFTYNKKKLVKQGFDPNKTEVEIMHELGHYRIYGCGQVRWEYYH
jgi:hypothetical protein